PASLSLSLRPPVVASVPYTTLFRSLNARRAFDISGRAAGAQHGAGNDGGAVGEQGAAQPAGFAFLDKIGTFRNPDHGAGRVEYQDRKSTRLNSSHVKTSYAVFCLKK